MSKVTIKKEVVSIPTYPVGKRNKNPMFLEKRVYQGSSGVVYPHPIIETVSDHKIDKSYTAIFLENLYLKIMFLPELGGRIQMAVDKTNDSHFVYYNRVIKPALVGLTGPWISGGIEFNWPQHHRPSTFEPVEYWMQDNDDGSKTLWLSEIERMFRTKSLVGFTLYPDKAYLELRVQLYNRTSEPQTFLWWANPAVHVNEDYQSVFPPDVYAVMDHGKRDVSNFPIATGTYYKMDYSPGTDISRYKNIPVPTSYMAYHSEFDFLGYYDHGKQAGMMHVANHHIVPGKKQWTWGNSHFGQMWDRQLTDEDGPYIELMCGAYTDNQPDFSWLHPGEEKRFTQVFMPYKDIGAAKSATKEVILNLDIQNNKAFIGVYVSRLRKVRILLLHCQTKLLDIEIQLSPEKTFTKLIDLESSSEEHEVTLSVFDNDQELISFTPLAGDQPDKPSPAIAAQPPELIESNEELYLNGLHLEQYRHATFEPEPYYFEALHRDPLDSRCNNAMGLLLLRRGKFEESESYFRKAVESLTRRNPNPYDGESYYNLGLALKLQAKNKEAYNAFYKSVWNAAWQNSGYFELARLASGDGRFVEALELLENSLATNTRHHKARHLKIALMRRLGNIQDALLEIENSLKQDCLDFGTLYERHLLIDDNFYQETMQNKVHNYIEIALDYAHAGLFEEAISLLNEAPLTDPMVKYYLASFNDASGDVTEAMRCFEEAAQMPSAYCFPHRIECVTTLETAMRHKPTDARAPYYLGNFWYAHRRYDEAIDCWETSRSLDPHFPTVHRNLGLAYMNKYHQADQALKAYELAFSLDKSDARVFFELDQLYKKLNVPPQDRLKRLEAHIGLVDTRDDLMIEYVMLLNLSGKPNKALDILLNRNFHPWEGGEGKVVAQYVHCMIEIAKNSMAKSNFQEALDSLKQAQIYPANLGEGKLASTQENHIHFYLGQCYIELGDESNAQYHYEQASIGSIEPNSPIYYNDQPPDMIYYQALALKQLGRSDSANALCEKLIEYGNLHLQDEFKMDYFAVSLPNFLVFDEDLNHRNIIHCYYMIALGYMGLEKLDEAREHFNQVLSLEPCHLAANIATQSLG